MRLVVASGKGGTGKTTVAVNLAAAALSGGRRVRIRAIRSGKGLARAAWTSESRVRILDCDVEEPNAHIFLRPEITRRETVTVLVPKVDEERCALCGMCAKACAFHAILVTSTRVVVFPELCHGCGACSYLCPENCIKEIPRQIGIYEDGYAAVGDGNIGFAHGILNPGEALAPPVVKRVKRERTGDELVIVDSPPGTSCTMVQSVKGADLCLLVTEPTPFGVHDLELAWQTVSKLGIDAAVAVNRADVGDDRVDRFCEERGIPVVARIPFDRELAAHYAEGRVLVTSSPEYARLFHAMLSELMRIAGNREAVREGARKSNEDVTGGGAQQCPIPGR